MKINENEIKNAKEKAIKILEEKEDKKAAIIEAIEILHEAEHASLIAEITMEAELAKSDKQYEEKLNLRTLNKEETEFYE